MAIDMSQFYQVFFEESAEHLAEMESLLLGLDLEAPDSEDLNAIFRAAHSIKGSSGTFGFTDLAELTHVLESLLDKIRKREISLLPEMVDAFLESGDVLKAMLAAHQGADPADPASIAAISRRLQQLTEGCQVAAPIEPAPTLPPVTVAEGMPEERVYRIEFVPTSSAVTTGGGVECFMAGLRKTGHLELLARPEAGQLGFWSLRLVTRHLPTELSEQLNSIAEHDAWRVEEEPLGDAPRQEAYGFFSDAPGLSDDLLGYGFFEPLPPVTPAAEIGDAYGFFEPLPEAPAPVGGDDNHGGFEPLSPPEHQPDSLPESIPVAPSGNLSRVQGEEGDGYGFFAPLPEVSHLSPAVVAEDDSYGFFAPLPPLVQPPETPLSPPATKRESPEAEVAHPEHALEGRPGNSRPVPKASGAGADSSIRVSVEKVDQLINLVGELVITQAMLLQTVAQMQESAPERLVTGLTQLERNTRDLQESVMSIRMLPISFVFSRFPRVVRDLSGKLGKQVELRTLGETTELDKGLIERIADPLTHLIRNSLDHGIELPEVRAAVGKNPVGTITLKASHQGGNVVIEVGDDGAGLQRQKILAKAREKGFQVSELMTDQEVFGLIFEAGFSTAEQVTDVSGRGVGMDVVRRNIQSLGGRIEIESMMGIGTRMTVRLPLTLAILDGMSVAVGDQTYILPLSYVMESMQPRAGDIKTLANQGRVILVRGEYLPVVALQEVFNIRNAETDFTQGIMVILDADGASAALFVDALVGQHQVVIKSLEANYRRVPGVSGATIMGDGHVALILDVSAIVGMGKQLMQRAA